MVMMLYDVTDDTIIVMVMMLYDVTDDTIIHENCAKNTRVYSLSRNGKTDQMI